MKPIKPYGAWMAEEITKTYLLGTDLLILNEDPDRKFDFLAINKLDSNQQIGIEVNASRYKRSEILREYLKKRKQYTKNRFPVIMFYIDYMERTGYTEVINKELRDELIDLNTANLSKQLRELWRIKKINRK